MQQDTDVFTPPLEAVAPERQRKRLPWGYVAVTALFLANAIIFMLVTPLFEAPGELPSLRYAVNSAQTGKLPVPTILDNWWALDDSQQPPLYYILASLFVHGVKPQTLDNLQANPSLSLAPEASTAPKNVILHPLNSQAWAKIWLPLYLLRILSILFSLGSLLITGLIVRLVTSAKPHPAILIVAGMNPLFLAISGSASSLALLVLLLIAALYCGLRIVYKQLYDWKWFAVLGALAGLASLVSVAGLLAWLILPLTALLLPRRTPGKFLDRRLGYVGLSLGVALVVSGWWYVRNVVLYGYLVNTTLIKFAAYGASMQAVPHTIEYLRYYWGLFGWGNIPADQLYYAFMGILGVLGILGLLLELARVIWEKRGVQGVPWRFLVMAGAWLLVLLVGVFLPLTQPSIGLLLAASSLIATASYLGLRAWMPLYLKTAVSWLMPSIVVILAMVVPWRYISPSYTPSPFLTMVQVPKTIHDVNLHFGNQLFLLGYEIDQDHVVAGDSATIRLYWLALANVDTDYRMQLQVNDPDQIQIGSASTFPEQGRLATSTMQPGNVAVDEYTVLIAKDTNGPTSAEVRVGVSNSADASLQSVTGADGQTLENLPVIAHLAVMTAKSEPVSPQVALNTSLGDQVLLVGYDLSTTELTPGGDWQVTLYWRPLVPLTQNYTIFIHLLDAEGNTVAQYDEQPVNNRYPTSFWQLQETVRDVHTIHLPADLPSASYTLSIGMYLLETGQRLPVIPSSPIENDILLGSYAPDAQR